MTPRTYQQRTLDCLYHWWVEHPGEAEIPLIVAPTGGGKSLIIAELTRLLFDTWPESHPRTLVLVPSKELAEQNADKLAKLLPTHISLGYYSASLGKKMPSADVIVATIGSIYSDAHLLGNIKCVIIDECFTGDTLVSTTKGQKRIDSVNVGDAVYTATGIGIVDAVSERKSNSICIVRLSNGTEIRTTDNHPFFTSSGWKQASDLARGDGIVRIQDMPELWRGISSLGKDDGEWKGPDQVSAAFRKSKVLLNILLKEKRECNVDSWGEGEDEGSAQEDSAQTVADWWKRPWNDGTTDGYSFDFIEWLDSGIGYQNRFPEDQRTELSDELQSGHRERGFEDCHRDRREFALREARDSRCKEGCNASFAWVESVSREELSSSEPVFNLQVSGHPSYYAGGVLVHNCHLVNPDGKEAGRYRKLLTALARTCSFRVVGLTATPFRGNGVWLTDGEEPLFTGIAATVTVRELLDAGYLAPLVRPKDVLATRIDTSDIKTVSGDYNLGDLAERVDTYLPAAAAEAAGIAADRKKWLAFLPTVGGAQHFVDCLTAQGISAALVCGETPAKERAALIADFRAGRIRCLVTVLALATGFDVPDVDCIIWLRPTISPVLYVQGAGRGLRIAEGKIDCLWLDFSDTTERMGPVDTIKGRKKRAKREDALAPHKICDQCGERCGTKALECPSCGFVFPVVEDELEARRASNAAIMAHQIEPVIVTYPVDRVEYGIHQKEGKPDSLKVDYFSGLRRVASEWVCLSHTGFARAKAEAWWLKRAPRDYLPGSTNQAWDWLQDDYQLTAPDAIRVNETGKYPEIIGYQWPQQQEAAV